MLGLLINYLSQLSIPTIASSGAECAKPFLEVFAQNKAEAAYCGWDFSTQGSGDRCAGKLRMGNALGAARESTLFQSAPH
jgi:hypothetical protein